MAWSLFKGKSNSDNILQAADEALAKFTAENKDCQDQKEQKMKRQVELWSILTPSEELKAEYKVVATDIAFLVKKILCLDQHIKDLQLARYHAQSGDAAKLKQLLAVPDPCANVTAEVPQVTF